jgi:hypothetical protein
VSLEHCAKRNTSNSLLSSIANSTATNTSVVHVIHILVALSAVPCSMLLALMATPAMLDVVLPVVVDYPFVLTEAIVLQIGMHLINAEYKKGAKKCSS